MYTVMVKHQNGSLISEIEIHNDYHLAPQKKLQSATLELEENTAGTFTFTVPKGQFGNGNGTDIDIKNDEVIVYQNVEVDPNMQTSRGKEIWRGYFLENSTEFFNSKTFTCIGELAYLNETIQRDAIYRFEGDNDYPEKVYRALLGVHNAKVPAKKQFQVGNVTVKADNTASHLVNRVQTDEFSTSYSDHTFDCIKKLIDSCGGYLKVRWENGVRYLDWLNAYEANGQTINFGKNLLDYTVNQDVTDLITVLYPFGESVSETVDDGQGGTTTKRVKINIGNATGQNGRLYVTLNDTGSYSTDPMVELGWREGTVDFPNVRDPNNLKRLAINYLKNQWDEDLKLYTTIQIKAVDLAYFTNEDADPIEFLQSVKVTSTPHGITNKVVPVTKMTIPLLQPEQTIYTMSTAMRKTKQISTSVTDHDKDIEKTQDTIDTTGGDGEEEEGEGEEVIEGKDPENYWTIGKPTVGKEPSEEKEGDLILRHQEHLKLWYDMSSEVQVTARMLPLYTWDTSEQGWVNHVATFESAEYSNGSHKTSAILENEPDRLISYWAPAYISEDLKEKDDWLSHTYVNGSDKTYVDGYANVRDPYHINVYWSGPWHSKFAAHNYQTSDGLCGVSVPLGWNTLLRTAGLSDGAAGSWSYCYGALTNVEAEKSGTFVLYDLGLDSYDDGAGTTYSFMARAEKPFNEFDVEPIPDREPSSSPSGGALPGWGMKKQIGRVFGSFAKGVMPIASRPLQGDSSLAIAIYAVVDFGYGYPSAFSAPGICSDHYTGFGVFNSDKANLKRWNTHLCYYYKDGNTKSYRMPALYDIDHIVNHLDSEASRPYPIDPIGRWWVYAWVRNIGPGEKYAIGSDITGGLFVGAANGGAVRTGCIKWGKPLETQNIFMHVPEYKLANDAKEQCIYINGVGRGPFGPSGNDNDDYHIGHFGGGTYPDYRARMRDTDQTNSALQIKAIGYCKAAYNQITTDEVVDNIKWLSRQYCSNS